MSHSIVAFTGAGISKDSGIPTYQEKPYMRRLFSRNFFLGHPEDFMHGYQQLIDVVQKAEPNRAHMILAERDIPIITQNIDGLHHRAGSKTVIELHGHYNRFFCTNCGTLLQEYILLCPRCQKGYVRPDIVLYGEDVKDWWKAYDLVAQAKLLLVIGTSLEVYPANQLPEMAQRNGARIVVINENAVTQVPEFLNLI